MTGMLFKRLVVWAFLLFVFVASASTLINLGAVGLSDRTSSTEQNEEQSEEQSGEQGQEQGQEPDPLHLLSGELAQTLEQRFDSHFSLRQIGLNVWAAFQFSVFNEAKKGLLIGLEGWLFSSEEFIAHAHAEQAIDENIVFMAQASQLLANRDVALLVLLIPSKARLLKAQLGSHQPALVQQSLYPLVLNSLREKGIFVVDGLQVMGGHEQPESLYLKTDTHWTPEGAALIASSAAGLVQQRIPELDVTTQKFITESTGSNSIEGDLLRFLPLTPLFDNLMPAPEHIELYQTYPAEDDAGIIEDRFADDLPSKPPQVVLVGTSFSADRRWNFDGALKQALAVDIENLSEQGQGPIVPMANFLMDYLPMSANLKLVIWEVPERYLGVSYPQLGAL